MKNHDDFCFSERKQIVYCVLTKKCNMVCTYCHVSKGTDLLDIDGYIDKLKIMLERKKSTSIVFYGGEPLVCVDGLKRIVLRLIDFYGEESGKLEFSLNTNGTLITPETAQFFTDYSIYPIISLDGMMEEENAYRTYPNGKCAYQDIISGMNMLRTAKTKFGVSAVLHDRNYLSIKQFLLWLKEEYSVDTVGVNLIHYNPKEFNTIDKFDEVSTLVELVKYAYDIGVTIPQYMPRINNICNGIKNATYCASCSKNKIILYPDYTISRCENYASKHEEFEKRIKLEPLKLGYKKECMNCTAFELCGGGCAPDMNNTYLRDRWCRLSKALYAFALEKKNNEFN